MNLADWLAQKKTRLRALGPIDIRNIRPSASDFAAAVTTYKRALAVILEVSPGNDALARYEEASVAALSVPVDDVQLNGSLQHLRDVHAQKPQLPLLCRDLFLSKEQVYLARLAGADAIELRAQILAPHELKTMMDIAASMHMACTVEVSNLDDLEKAVRAGARIFVVSAWGADEALSTAQALSLAHALPKLSVCLLRGPFITHQALDEARPVADAVWLDSPRLAQSWQTATGDGLAAFIQYADNGPTA